MSQKKRYRIYCLTESANVEGDTILDTVPTLCPNNPAHEVNADSKTVILMYAEDNLEATTDPTKDDDVNAGYIVGSSWINTSTGREYVCTDNASGAAKWRLTVQNEIHITCGSIDKEYSKVTSTTYTAIRKILFLGTAIVGTPVGVAFYVGPSAGGTMDVRLRDVTNNNNIAAKTGLTATGIYLDASTSNWPSASAILELQMRVSTEGQTAYVSDVVIGF